MAELVSQFTSPVDKGAVLMHVLSGVDGDDVRVGPALIAGRLTWPGCDLSAFPDDLDTCVRYSSVMAQMYDLVWFPSCVTPGDTLVRFRDGAGWTYTFGPWGSGQTHSPRRLPKAEALPVMANCLAFVPPRHTLRSM